MRDEGRKVLLDKAIQHGLMRLARRGKDARAYRLRLVGALEGLLAPARATLPRLLSFREADLSRVERTR
ncbi:hypothetical protein ACMHYB_29395 [Sorangium sp. So ce1128]